MARHQQHEQLHCNRRGGGEGGGGGGGREGEGSGGGGGKEVVVVDVEEAVVKEERKRELLQHRVRLNIYISLGCDTGMDQSSADRIPISLHNLRTVFLMANL